MWETQVRSLGQEDSLEKEMASEYNHGGRKDLTVKDAILVNPIRTLCWGQGAAEGFQDSL